MRAWWCATNPPTRRNVIGRHETLEQDRQQVCARIGVPAPVLPHKRQATDHESDYRSYYSDALAERVGEHFRRDIELLGYRFDAPDAVSPGTRIEPAGLNGRG